MKFRMGIKSNLLTVSLETSSKTNSGVLTWTKGMNSYIWTALISDQRKAKEAPLEEID